MKNLYLSFKRLMLTIVLVLTANVLWSQTVTVYSCGFETASDATQWTMVNDAASGNGWYIGTAAYRSGTHSMYISNTNGTTADYNKSAASIVMAYYTVTLTAGVEYAVSYDWRGRGEAGVDEVSVCLLNNPADVITAVSGTTYPTWYAATVQKTLSNSMIWQSSSFPLIGTGQPQRIVFIWKNDGNGTGTNPPAGVDNFYIREVSPLNYFHGFEDSVENANWKLVNHASCVNKWVVGSADYNIGPKALYISPDSGATATYLNREGWVTATREFVFPAGSQIDVTFDWKCYGELDMDFMSVCWVTDSTETIGSNANTSLPAWATSTAMQVGNVAADKKQMVRSSQWQTASFSLSGTGRPGRLVFIWKNNSSAIYEPGAVVDNLQITTRKCQKPGDLSATLLGTTATLTWTGDANASYEVLYRNTYQDQNAAWNTLTNQTSPCQVTNLDKGLYTFWVRAICDSSSTGQSAWAKIQNFLVITNDACINYIDLHNTSLVTGTYGSYSNPTQNTGIIDNGQMSETSRHTVNTVHERDERTGYGLRMIPDGELASVRLGNWRLAEGETLTYNFKVDSQATILLMKYAVVLENPSGHSSDEKPKFQMQILDANNQLVDPNCGQADFTAGVNTTGWNTYGGVVWKDWTLVGLNLQAYAGQNMKVRLTTLDCTLSGHYGYAYFTLDCAKSSLEGLSCGENAADSICAPEGFVYKWYRTTNLTQVVSTSRCFTPPIGDTVAYVCRAEFPDKASCFYTLQAVLAPRWPIARATSRWEPTNCNNNIRFINNCAVTTSGGDLQGEKVDEYYWDFGNGTTSTSENPVVDYGPAGGQFDVMLVANMSHGECSDTLRFKVNVPQIRPFHKKDVARICSGQTYKWNGKTYTETGLYVDSLKTIAGCDSILELDLLVSNLFEITDSATICEGESYAWNGKMLDETGFYSDTLRTTAGCDSVTNMRLTVNPVIKVDWDNIPQICEDDENFAITYTNNGSIPTKYSIKFTGDAVTQGFADQEGAVTNSEITIPIPTGARAGYYEANVEFEDENFDCGSKLFPMKFTVNYSRFVIKQLWNDVLGLKNMTYNGGYDFVSYQWYFNGTPLEGETAANYYVENGELDFTGYYQAKIVRADGIELFTCPFRPTKYSDDINVTPITVVSMSFTVEAPKMGNVQVYNTSGILVMTYNIQEGENDLRAPSYPGIYLVRVNLENGLQKTTRLIVVNQ